MTRLRSQISWLGQHNAELVLKNIEANTKMTDLGAGQRALEEELARVTGERDVQRATTEQKARETEEQTAELQRLRTALEQKETELLQKEVTVVTLSGTLQEKGKALEEKGGGYPERGGRPQGEGKLIVLARGGRLSP